MRGLVCAVVLAVVAVSPAFACTIIDPSWSPPQGLSEVELQAWYKRESTPQAIERRLRRRDMESQKARWEASDHVFLAEVRELRLTDDNEVTVVLRTVVSLKGDGLARNLRDSYSPDFNSTCGPTVYPGIGESAIFYARRLPWWQRLLSWGQPTITSAEPLRLIADPRIPSKLRAAADRLRKAQT